MIFKNGLKSLCLQEGGYQQSLKARQRQEAVGCSSILKTGRRRQPPLVPEETHAKSARPASQSSIWMKGTYSFAYLESIAKSKEQHWSQQIPTYRSNTYTHFLGAEQQDGSLVCCSVSS
ncbi:hypothetical protein EI42_04035 [Thermosporothrix hazakensis]|jgi:hypothetical protein|uniref:Uncharacterized protein n=1 Tax=Thermosporothrix hazakensis TaxID=644383 RepID=A0A326U6E4_THEHA|nr:hypothetical protein EI42_04035 [Thermosporothrix hazakensis]